MHYASTLHEDATMIHYTTTPRGFATPTYYANSLHNTASNALRCVARFQEVFREPKITVKSRGFPKETPNMSKPIKHLMGININCRPTFSLPVASRDLRVAYR